MIYDGELTDFMHSVIQSGLYYPRYWGVLNFGLKNRLSPKYADIRGVDDRGLTVLDKVGRTKFWPQKPRII